MSKIIVNTEVMGPDFSELVLHELNYEWSREVVTLAASEADLPFGMVLMREAGEYKPLTESTVESAQKLDGTPVTVDAVVCATGFEPGGLTGLDGALPAGAGVHVARSHRAVIDGVEVPGLYVQGADLPGHGLGTTLLSNVAVRAGEIARALDQEESP